jgi:F-box protein, helicase, 18
MQLTAEQKAIINSSGDIKINAVAGSGKTTTLVAYAQARPQQRILYLAFNKSVKTEAVKKFNEKKITNVTVETAHSLAFHHIVKHSGYTVKKEGGYKTTEVAEILELTGDANVHTRYILANHINKLITCFCNSDKAKVQELDYESTISDTAARQFVQNFKAVIEKQARIFLAKMDKQEMIFT